MSSQEPIRREFFAAGGGSEQTDRLFTIREAGVTRVKQLNIIAKQFQVWMNLKGINNEPNQWQPRYEQIFDKLISEIKQQFELGTQDQIGFSFNFSG